MKAKLLLVVTKGGTRDMKGTNLTHNQIIAIGSAILFGLPLCAGFVAGHFLGFWPGVMSGGLVLLFIVYLAQRWVKGIGKQDNEPATKGSDDNRYLP
jgi:hypothetical protein